MNSSAPCWRRRGLSVLICAALFCDVVRLCAQLPPAAEFKPDKTLLSTRDLKPIFNGTNLDGWVIRGGQATYRAVDGMIVGTCAVKNGGNTFLCTEKEYGDFILELEIQADKGLNSGVQIRSHCFDEATTYDFGNRVIKVPAKRVHGYQVEVDHRPERRWSGGIYEEGRREWLHPLATNSPAGQAFKFGEWNKYRIQCLGSSIKTWVNDIPAADLVDAETLTGFIGLQVHTSDKPEYQVRFRNLRLQDLGERQWRTAWDCRSLDALVEQGAAEWKLEDGVLHALHSPNEAKEGRLSGQAGLSEFTIRMKYKIAQGGFSLDFRSDEGEKEHVSYNYRFTDQVGATNVAKLNDWNTVTASYRKKRMVWNLNGHQLSDTTSGLLHSDSLHPGLVLTGGEAADIYFKGFEILEGAQ